MQAPIVKTHDDYMNGTDIVIETNLTADEKAVIMAGRKERKERPEHFTPWARIKADKALLPK